MLFLPLVLSFLLPAREIIKVKPILSEIRDLITFEIHIQIFRESAKKILTLMARPLRGEGVDILRALKKSFKKKKKSRRP